MQDTECSDDSKVQKERRPKDSPFAWQSKTALRRIRDAFDGSGTVTSALAVYVALTEIASDAQRATFKTSQAHITALSGVQTRTVQARLRDLVEIGLITINRPALKTTSTYTVLPIRNGCATIRKRSNQASLRTVEESPEEFLEERQNKGSEGSSAPTVCAGLSGENSTGEERPDLDSLMAYVEAIHWQEEDEARGSIETIVEKFHSDMEGSDYRIKGERVRDVYKVLDARLAKCGWVKIPPLAENEFSTEDFHDGAFDPIPSEVNRIESHTVTTVVAPQPLEIPAPRTFEPLGELPTFEVFCEFGAQRGISLAACESYYGTMRGTQNYWRNSTWKHEFSRLARAR